MATWEGPGEPIVLKVYGPDGEVAVPLTPVRALELAQRLTQPAVTAIKTSQWVSAIDTVPGGISWDGINTPWIGALDNKLYLTSGQFTSTLKTSEAVGAIDANPRDIETNDLDGRVPVTTFDTPMLGASLIGILGG